GLNANHRACDSRQFFGNHASMAAANIVTVGHDDDIRFSKRLGMLFQPFSSTSRITGSDTTRSLKGAYIFFSFYQEDILALTDSLDNALESIEGATDITQLPNPSR